MFGAMLCQHYICLYVINAKLICQILKGFPVPKISKPTEPTLVYIWLKLDWMTVLPTDSDSKVMFLLLETDKHHVFKVHMTWNIIAVYLKGFLKITNKTKWYLLCCCHDNTFATGPVLIKTEIPSFHLNQGPFTLSNLMMRVKTIW